MDQQRGKQRNARGGNGMEGKVGMYPPRGSDGIVDFRKKIEKKKDRKKLGHMEE
eukprot:NODE_5952_length_478_cov_81.736597_g4479_i0.p1 GENE.NODE_5952_length_478_cov_81.736597_g4479_i0~~NODE_5952_length_478_cov_81.736597_g4479_i0.p1  ORF type:complete len:54 (+),score=1.83 NODE_5952_length_478_cov_81.736597_g4479_i0:149-310(+)